jgi:hypothetical protein
MFLPTAKDIFGGRCEYFCRPLKIRKALSFSLFQRLFTPVSKALYPCINGSFSLLQGS